MKSSGLDFLLPCFFFFPFPSENAIESFKGFALFRMVVESDKDDYDDGVEDEAIECKIQYFTTYQHIIHSSGQGDTQCVC